MIISLKAAVEQKLSDLVEFWADNRARSNAKIKHKIEHLLAIANRFEEGEAA